MLQAEIIDREDIRQSMKVIMNMTRRLKSGENLSYLQREQDQETVINFLILRPVALKVL